LTDEVEIIPAEQARAVLEQAICERLGDDWRDEDSGWHIVTQHDYMARLTRGRINLDFYVDLLGNVEVKQSEIDAAQDSWGLIAVSFIVLSLAIVYLLMRALGLI
jgi:hypothetical protein